MRQHIWHDVLDQFRTVEFYHNQTTVLSSLGHSLGWMLGNTLLAWIPVGLALWLFAGRVGVNFPIAPPRSRTLHWLVIAMIIAFLPNAPYLLTDIVHLDSAIRNIGPRAWLLLPIYVLVIGSALIAYALTLRLLLAPVVARGYVKLVAVLLVSTHLACAIGIQLGRAQRLNSWWFVTRPLRVLEGLSHALTDPASQLFIVIVFVATTVGHIFADRVLVKDRFPQL